VLLTPRLQVRPPVESDRERFVELFSDPSFMVFSGGTLSVAQAHRRFDHMLSFATEVPFAKQPVVERSTGAIVGYTGVDRFELEGVSCLEHGWRLVPEARGKGYATEAGRALLERAAEVFQGEVIVMLDPSNTPSRKVADKLGYAFWKRSVVDGDDTDVLRRWFGPQPLSR
jgi:RimJ/RimL family protein N-acetyltransferase